MNPLSRKAFQAVSFSATKDKNTDQPFRRSVFLLSTPRYLSCARPERSGPACRKRARSGVLFSFFAAPLPPFVSTSPMPQHSCDSLLSKPRNLLMTLLYHKKLVMSSQKSQVSCDYPLTKPKIQRSILSKAVCICRGGARRVFW
jgi:hypothetical protein